MAVGAGALLAIRRFAKVRAKVAPKLKVIPLIWPHIGFLEGYRGDGGLDSFWGYCFA